jgi:peptidoglycan/LPS O-acetylase OafA/YrhL
MWPARDNAGSVYQYRYFGSFRLLLATLVMAQHFGADLAPAPLAAVLAPYMTGSVAVLVFFALSGFVITEAVDSVYRSRPAPFLTNRLLRIVPHFLLAVVLSMLAHEFFRLAGGVRLWRSQPSFPDNAFGLSNVLLNFFAIAPMGRRVLDYDFLTITWAVRVEMVFYLTMFCCIAIGRRLPWPRGLAVIASGLLVLMLLLSWPIIQGKHGPDMLAFTPYFAFGGGLYFATAGSRAGWLTVLASIPMMLWQFIESQMRSVPIQGIPLSITGNLIILIALLGAMSALAFASIAKSRAIDRTFGDLTYPLYLYHEDVLVVILTVTTGYAYSTLAAGFVLSFVTAAILMMLVDPAVTRYRDKVCGRALRQAQVPVGSGAEPSAPAIGLRSAPR